MHLEIYLCLQSLCSLDQNTSRLTPFEVRYNEAWRNDDLSWWPCCATNMLRFGWGLPAAIFTKDTVKKIKQKEKEREKKLSS